MKITNVTFTGEPAQHLLPAIYEDLGLPNLSSFFEQHFEFLYLLGQKEGKGHGSIRLYKGEPEPKVIIDEKLPGIGRARLLHLQKLLLEKLELPFMDGLKSGSKFKKVFYTNFRRGGPTDH